MAEMTAFGETLIRWAKNTWAWSDNSPALNVRDMTASEYYNFRVRAGRSIDLRPFRVDQLRVGLLHLQVRSGDQRPVPGRARGRLPDA
jgi:hypothetical protein